jgi:hypothetical protein
MRVLIVLFLFLVSFGLVEVAQAQQGSITGWVGDNTGENLEGITVKLLRVETQDEIIKTTDARGEFSFENLAVGLYTIEFYDGGYAGEPYTFEVGENEVTIEAAVMGDTNTIYVCGTVRALLYNNENQPIDTAGVQEIKLVHRLGTRTQIEALKPELNYFRFDLVPVGNTTLTIKHPDYEIWTEQFELTHEGRYWDRLYLQARSAVLSISPKSFSLYSGKSVTLVATLSSAVGPLENRTVTWATTAGTLSPENGVTDEDGRVRTTYTAPMVENQMTITITASYAGDDYPAAEWSITGTVSPPPKGILERLKELMVPWGVTAIVAILVVIVITRLVLRFLAKRAVPEVAGPEELEF